MGQGKKKTIDEVRKEFEDGGCVLLSDTYVRSRGAKLDYICNCGREAQIDRDHFLQGQRCRVCRYNTVSEKAKARGSGTKRRRDWREDREWRTAVYKRDDYTCRKCGKRGVKLNAHHVKAFFTHEDERYDIENGITLCQPCHTRFHKEFGYKRFKPDDSWVYINITEI